MSAALTLLVVVVAMVLAVVRPGTEPRRPRPWVYVLGAVALLVLGGALELGVAAEVALELWRPMITLGGIMLLTEVAVTTGTVDWWAQALAPAGGSVRVWFVTTFLAGLLCASLLSNDAAILLLTPVVVGSTQKLAPDRPDLPLPMAYAVFASAGVAPFPVGNPMNLFVTQYVGIDFLSYARFMVPIALVVAAVSLASAAFWFRGALHGRVALPEHVAGTGLNRWVTAVLCATLVGYGVASWLGGPLWAVALVGAAVASQPAPTPKTTLLRDGIQWRTLAFLAGVVLCAVALREAGVTEVLAATYAQASPRGIGVGAALGSALFNNHPTAYLHMFALQEMEAPRQAYLAALVGGDLGPRLLPSGSLAGLLWMEILGRHGIEPSLGTFVTTGIVLAVPALLVGLLLFF